MRSFLRESSFGFAALLFPRLAARDPPPPAVAERRLRASQRLTGREQRVERVALAARELVDRPRGDGRLAQLLDGVRGGAVAAGAQLLRARVTLRDEVFER